VTSIPARISALWFLVSEFWFVCPRNLVLILGIIISSVRLLTVRVST
jgi:hypothetical protein